jgi:hypothetical protein
VRFQQLADVSLAGGLRHSFFSFGYSASLDKKKHYLQSMLHAEPVGFASKSKGGGALEGEVSSAAKAICACPRNVTRLDLHPVLMPAHPSHSACFLQT